MRELGAAPNNEVAAGAGAAPNMEGAAAAPNMEGVEAAPNMEGVEAAPNMDGAGAGVAPNREGVDAGAAPNMDGAMLVPNAGALTAGAGVDPNKEGAEAAGVLENEKAEGVAAGVDPNKPDAGAPNAGFDEAPNAGAGAPNGEGVAAPPPKENAMRFKCKVEDNVQLAPRVDQILGTLQIAEIILAQISILPDVYTHSAPAKKAGAREFGAILLIA